MPRLPEQIEGPAFGMMTIFDEIAQSHPLPLDLTSGTHESFVVYDGVARGISVLARCSWRKALLGFKIDPHEGDIAVTVDVTLDEVTHRWWLNRYEDLGRADSERVRHVVVRAQGDVVGGFTVSGDSQQISHTFVVRGDQMQPGGLLMLELLGFEDRAFVEEVNAEPLQGLQLDAIRIRPTASGPGPQVYVDTRHSARRSPQGCVVTREEPFSLRFRLAEQPPLPETLSSSSLSRAVGRGLRKAGVLSRSALRRSGRFARDAEAVTDAFRVDAFRPDGRAVDVSVALLEDDVLQLTFPAGVVFFELATREEALGRLGYDGVAFDFLAN